MKGIIVVTGKGWGVSDDAHLDMVSKVGTDPNGKKFIQATDKKVRVNDFYQAKGDFKPGDKVECAFKYLNKKWAFDGIIINRSEKELNINITSEYKDNVIQILNKTK